VLQIHSSHALGPDADRLAYAREIVHAEANSLSRVAERLDQSFLQAVDLLFQGSGRVCLTGTGKSADVAQKIAGTLNSTGTRAYFLDATRALHGDLGMVAPQDIVLALSHSGESEEVVRLLGPLRQVASALLALRARLAVRWRARRTWRS
jgi:arabinose-5-phosphate isomerase